MGGKIGVKRSVDGVCKLLLPTLVSTGLSRLDGVDKNELLLLLLALARNNRTDFGGDMYGVSGNGLTDAGTLLTTSGHMHVLSFVATGVVLHERINGDLLSSVQGGWEEELT